MQQVFHILFWVAFYMLVYIYFGYPVLVYFLSFFRKKEKRRRKNDYTPPITLVIPARNEERVIEKKLLNCLDLVYPSDKLEILVLSDQSTDRTVEIVRSFRESNIHLIDFTERKGKTFAQNIAAEKAQGEILVFSDANAMYKQDALLKLVSHFEDDQIGCVCGELCYDNSQQSAVGKEEGLYWQYEKFIKRCEDRLFSIIGANGSIYAVRKVDYQVLEQDIISDFIEPLEVLHQGKKVKYESNAISVEKSSVTFHEELSRKRRIISRSIYSLVKRNHLMNPFDSVSMFFELFSHKLLRWASPLFQMILLSSNLFLLTGSKYRFVLGLQVCFYLLSFIGYLFRKSKNVLSFVYMPFYFNLINYASLLGIIDWATRRNTIFWEPIR